MFQGGNMITIKLSAYEQGELLRYLEYAKEQKKANQLLIKEGQKKFDDTKYDLFRINILMQRIQGKYTEDYLQNTWNAGEYI